METFVLLLMLVAVMTARGMTRFHSPEDEWYYKTPEGVYMVVFQNGSRAELSQSEFNKNLWDPFNSPVEFIHYPSRTYMPKTKGTNFSCKSKSSNTGQILCEHRFRQYANVVFDEPRTWDYEMDNHNTRYHLYESIRNIDAEIDRMGEVISSRDTALLFRQVKDDLTRLHGEMMQQLRAQSIVIARELETLYNTIKSSGLRPLTPWIKYWTSERDFSRPSSWECLEGPLPYLPIDGIETEEAPE